MTTITTHCGKTITQIEAEAAFQKIERLFQEAFLTFGELFGGPGPRSCSATNRFVHVLKDAATMTRRDIDAGAGVFLNAIPVLTMYLLGIEAGFVEHPRGWERTERGKSIIYAPDLTRMDANANGCHRESNISTEA